MELSDARTDARPPTEHPQGDQPEAQQQPSPAKQIQSEAHSSPAKNGSPQKPRESTPLEKPASNSGSKPRLITDFLPPIKQVSTFRDHLPKGKPLI